MYAIVPLFIRGLWLCTGGKLTTREKWMIRNMSPFLFSNQTKDRMASSFEPNTKWNGSIPPTKQLLELFHSKNMGWSHSIPSRSPTKRILTYFDRDHNLFLFYPWLQITYWFGSQILVAIIFIFDPVFRIAIIDADPSFLHFTPCNFTYHPFCHRLVLLVLPPPAVRRRASPELGCGCAASCSETPLPTVAMHPSIRCW